MSDERPIVSLTAEWGRVPHPKCIAVSWWRTLTQFIWHGFLASGCDYEEAGRAQPAFVTVLRCRRCDKFEVLWEPIGKQEDDE